MNKQQSSTPRYTCSEYRQEMILAALTKALQNPRLSVDERQQILEEIHRIEKEMKL